LQCDRGDRSARPDGSRDLAADEQLVVLAADEQLVVPRASIEWRDELGQAFDVSRPRGGRRPG
jgi:hypothetical protein